MLANNFLPCTCWMSSPVYLLKESDSDRERVRLTDALSFRDGAPHTHCFALVCVPRLVVVSADWAISRQYCFHCLHKNFTVSQEWPDRRREVESSVRRSPLLAMKRSNSAPMIPDLEPLPPSLQIRRGLSTSNVSLPGDIARPEISPRRPVS